MAVIYGTTSSDIKNGTEGNDTIYGWASGRNASSPSGNDTLNGNAGNDKLYGGTGNDTVFGNSGNDILQGSAGDDFLASTEGNDTLIGGAGADIFFISGPLSGFTTITDFQWQQGDKIQVAASAFGDSYYDFQFDHNTGKLYYMPAETAFASLQLNSSFDISLDLSIV
jgi:Ca2+-binding RTX toxin-like protein